MSQINPKYVSRATSSKFFGDLLVKAYIDPNSRHHPSTFPMPTLRTVAWNNIGSRIATGGPGGVVRVVNPEKADHRYATEFKLTGVQVVEKVAWDPTHSEKLADCGGGDSSGSGGGGPVKFWDYRTAKATAEIKTGADNISLTYHPDGYQVAVGRKDDQIKFIDLRQNAIISTVEESGQTNQQVFSPSGDLLFQTHGSGLVKVREHPSHNVLYSFDAHASACYCAEVDPRGRYLATGGSDALVALWDTKDWACVRTFDKADHPIRTISFSFDGSFLAAGSDEPMPIDIMHVDTGEYVHTIPNNMPSLSVAWHPSKYILAFASDTLKVVGVGGSS